MLNRLIYKMQGLSFYINNDYVFGIISVNTHRRSAKAGPPAYQLKYSLPVIIIC